MCRVARNRLVWADNQLVVDTADALYLFRDLFGFDALFFSLHFAGQDHGAIMSVDVDLYAADVGIVSQPDADLIDHLAVGHVLLRRQRR